MREFKIVFAFSFFLSIVRDSVVAGTVAADVSPHFNLPRIDNSTERINYSLFFEGITKTDGQPEGQNNPKQVLTGESFHAQLTTGEALDHASLMGWDIGVATATNGRGYSNQDNFLIRLYSEVVPEKEKEQPRFRPTIGLFAVFDGHGRYGHIASRTAMETTRQLADAAFSNYAELVEKGWAHIRQMAKFGYVVNETIPMEPSVIEQSIQKFIMDIYRNVEEALMQGSELGTTMTLVVWDLKQQKLYAASAGDSLAFKGNSESKTLDLISADHGANNPAEQDRIRKAMQNYFRIPPRKSSFEGKITVVWQTPGEYDGWPDELKSYGVVSPTDEGWTPSEQDLESRKMDEDEDEKDHGFGDVEISEIIANDTSTAKPTLSSSQNPTTVDKAPSALSLLQLGLSTTSAPTETNNTSTGDSVDTNPFVRMILEMMSLPTIRGERIMPGQVPGYGSLNFQVVPEERGIYEDFRVGGLQPTRSMGDGGKGPSIDSSAFIRSDPEIKVYHLNDPILSSSIDFVLMTSDGFTNVHGTNAMQDVYSKRVHSCQSATSSCLDDPLRRYYEWYNSTEIFYPPYDAAHKALADASDKQAFAAMYKLVADTMKTTSTNEGASKILKKTLQIQSQSSFQWKDDITFIYVGRKPDRTGDKTINQHLLSRDYRSVSYRSTA